MSDHSSPPKNPPAPIPPSFSAAKTKIKPFINTRDLPVVVDILAKADNISTEEAVRRLNNMCEKGLLTIIPVLGKPSNIK